MSLFSFPPSEAENKILDKHLETIATTCVENKLRVLTFLKLT